MTPDERWDAMREWLVESLAVLGDGELIEIGPCGTPVDAEGWCDCAEVWRLGGRWLVRLSREVMLDVPDGVDALPSDSWVRDPAATDGRLATEDAELVAGAVVTWFRDRIGVGSTTDLAFNHFAATDVT